MGEYRIGLIGCAGLGKSTLASKISSELRIPFINSKGITRPVLKKFGYEYSSDCFVEKFLSKKEIENEIVTRRLEEESILSSGFVTDRTTLECFCYAFLGLTTYTDNDFKLLEKTCRSNMKNYTDLYFIPISSGWYESNGIRTVNINFQRMIEMLIEGVASDWGVQMNRIPEESISSGRSFEFIMNNLKEKQK